MVLDALGREPSAAWGRDAQGDILEQTPAILPLNAPVAPQLPAGLRHEPESASDTFTRCPQVTSIYTCSGEHKRECCQTRSPKEKDKKKKDKTKPDLRSFMK